MGVALAEAPTAFFFVCGHMSLFCDMWPAALGFGRFGDILEFNFEFRPVQASAQALLAP